MSQRAVAVRLAAREPDLWRALASPWRRRLLDLLRDAPATTGALADQIPELSRFAVMQHLGVLTEAGVVIAERRGRDRINHLNPVPLRAWHERWVQPLADAGSAELLALRRRAETGECMATELEEFQLILLRRPDGAPSYDSQTLDSIQREHVAFYAYMREAGYVVTNGPMAGQSDEALRGMAIFAVESVERARELASSDPSVQAGRLEVHAMAWWCPPGTMIRSGAPVTVED